MISLQNMANAVRFLAIDMVERANSGHPGAPMGMADIATVLWTKFLRFNPNNPKWYNRDRFVMSNAHASAMQYALLYLTGYPDINLEDLKNFRQIDSKTAGHPEYGLLSGVEATGGPLGQGLAMSVGMAISAKMAQARFGEHIANHKIYTTCGDGDLMEGISEEAISLAGHLKLNNLVVLWDNNQITIDGNTSIATSTNQLKRFEANGWTTYEADGHNYDEIEKALTSAQNSEKPVFIAFKTQIGFGSPNKAGKSSSHGSPLGEEEIALTRKALRWHFAPFEVPEDILSAWRSCAQKGIDENKAWDDALQVNPNKQAFLSALSGRLPTDFDAKFAEYKRALVDEKPVLATRKSSQNALEKITSYIPNIIGGSADLSASNLTKTSNSKVITSDDFSGNYIEYGIREHAMGAIMNGIALDGLFKIYAGTFFVFVDYLKPAVRLAALMKQKVIYVLTHDSIGVGEDGATHQPIEQLAMLRSVPNLCTIRPCDALECAESWQIALHNHKPTALILSRQNLPFVRISADENKTSKGAYIVSTSQAAPQATLIATGSEVGLAIEAQKKLKERGIEVNVVSMPSWDLFEEQTQDYRDSVILPNVPAISVEAASPFGWERYADKVLGINHFGASGPAKKVYEKAGLDVENVVQAVIEKVL
ncbi:MAG: transketolase [Alphaproteobacteria bacterium]